MSVFPLLVIVHALAATVWTGGHLVLDLGVLPRALRAQSAAQVRAFEEVFEPLGLTALAIQVLTGLWMGWIYLPGFQGLFRAANPSGLAWHIRGITALAIAFVVVGPVAVVDKTVDLKGTRKAAEALAAYLFTNEAQQVFAEDRFAPVKTFFSVKDFGGWSQVNKEFFGNGGIWDRLFANTR